MEGGYGERRALLAANQRGIHPSCVCRSRSRPSRVPSCAQRQTGRVRILLGETLPDDQAGGERALGYAARALATEPLYGAVVYYKGPLFFRALRQQVGDQRFDAILRAYFQAYRYGVAYPQDFLAIAERVSGQELDGLYEEWILGK